MLYSIASLIILISSMLWVYSKNIELKLVYGLLGSIILFLCLFDSYDPVISMIFLVLDLTVKMLITFNMGHSRDERKYSMFSKKMMRKHIVLFVTSMIFLFGLSLIGRKLEVSINSYREEVSIIPLYIVLVVTLLSVGMSLMKEKKWKK